jgi:hypothetical protein
MILSHLRRVFAAALGLVVVFVALPESRRAVAALPDVAAAAADSSAAALYASANLAGILDREVFEAAYQRVLREPTAPTAIAIADMRQPSTARRLVIVDLLERRVALRTWVAHGSGSGELHAERFSNRHGSHQTSLGLYRVGARIRSPKHGAALLLDGLDRGLNDHARSREVIIHGADYVSERFIAQTGRLGRSWGCPAVPRDQMAQVIALLGDGGLLYIHGA